MKITVALCLLALTVTVQAQQLTGRVVDTDGHPVSYVNIALYAADDSTRLVTGAVTDTAGIYRTQSLPSGTYRLHASFIGYETTRRTVTIPTEDRVDIVMRPDGQLLNELVVEGERPAMKVEADRLTYHVPVLLKNRPITNAYDALKEIPGVIEQQGLPYLIGATGTTILLNGRKTSMTEQQLVALLKSTPLSRLEDVEIMYSAPPKYNIRGAAINVVLMQQTADTEASHWQGELAAELTRQTYNNAGGRASLLYQGKQTMVDALYAYADERYFSHEQTTALHTLNGTSYAIFQDGDGSGRSHNHNARLSVQHTLGNGDRLSAAYTGMFSPSHSKRRASIDMAGTITNSASETTSPSTIHNLTADYEAHFGLNVGADYTHYVDRSDYQLVNHRPSSSSLAELIAYRSKQQISRLVVYANQSHKLPHELAIEYGASYTGSNTHNLSDAQKNGAGFADATFNTRQHEQFWNLFAGFTKPFGSKFSLQASLAAEYYHATETSSGATRTLWNNVAWFPTINASFTPSSQHIVQLAVSSDKKYPPYWAISPNIHYLSSYNTIHGNPHLRPQRTYDLRLTYLYRQKYILQAFAGYIPDYYTQVPYQSREKLERIYITQNFNFRQNAGLLAMVPFKIGQRISSRVIVNGVYTREKDSQFFDLSFDRQSFMGFFIMNHDVIVATRPDLKLNVSGYVTTGGGIQGLYDLGPSGNLSTGLTWTFDRQRARLILKGDDLLNTQTPRSTVNFQDQQSELKLLHPTRTITLSFVYRFGGYKKQDEKKIDTSRFGVH